MELREFAERVLFATTLEEKLQGGVDLTDDHPGTPLAAPVAPGRPAELRFKTQGSGAADFPGMHRLEDERERGRLLHFFANHELLATELMALVLLRFPEAPAAFRRGVAQTLRDEQAHTRLYLDRMRACGTGFGELPVSGYFWRCVSTMEHPLDYVTALSLTFEQANLDFCRHFAAGFEQVGDRETASLLESIYRDEIGHVALGLKWFRRWKNPEISDWEAFCRQLKFPLSPQRAKGPRLNREGRAAAGLDASFISELSVYSQSKGRTPGVYWFNPFAEGHIASGKRYSPKKHQTDLATDLANLPQFLCRQDDIVLLAQRPSVDFLSNVKEAGFPLPEFVELERGQIPAKSSLPTRKIGALRPWAWGPDSAELYEPLFTNLTGEKRTRAGSYNGGIGRLYSKAWSAELLGEVLAERDEEAWLCGRHEVGVSVNTMDEAMAAVAAIRARGHHRVVVKEALGLAGHNAIRLWEPEILESQRRWMERSLQGGGQLVVEPWLERVADFSAQLEMDDRALQLRGWTGLLNDARGQFQANWAAANYHRRIPANITALFPSIPDFAARVQSLYARIFTRLQERFRKARYAGPAGIDAFVYRAEDGTCRLKPVVEINPRYTMGRVVVELMKRVAPGACGAMRLASLAGAKAAGFDGFAPFAKSLKEQFPLQLEGEPVAKIRSGVLCLNEPEVARVCLAVFRVAGTPGEALRL